MVSIVKVSHYTDCTPSMALIVTKYSIMHHLFSMTCPLTLTFKPFGINSKQPLSEPVGLDERFGI